MALVPWRGPITLENVETGDGRVFAADALTWSDLPLPLAFLRDGDQHVDLTEVAPQVGTIETIVRSAGGSIDATGFIDDETPDGAEVVRRMNAGSAPLGDRFPVSIDGDNWTVQVIVRDPELLEMLEEDGELGAETVRFTAQGTSTVHLRAGAPRLFASPVRAAAGDPDPGENGDGVLLLEDAAEFWLERFTSLRIRGATLCAVAAFDGAAISLGAEPAAVEESPAAETAAAGISAPATAAADPYPPLPIPARPPRDAFFRPEPQAGCPELVEQPDGSWAVPLTITEDFHVYGHLATRDGAHRGYSSRVTAPRSEGGYREFHVGAVVCEDGSSVNVGPLTVGGDHAPLSMSLGQARDFYANSTMGWADGRVIDGQYGPWFSGFLRPGLNDADLRVIRSLAPSGDWRADAAGNLELICGLMVNVPGFPVAREAMAAAANVGHTLTASAWAAPGISVDNDRLVTVVAAGIVSRCSECAERARTAAARGDFEGAVMGMLQQLMSRLGALDARTRHLTPAAIDALQARLHG